MGKKINRIEWFCMITLTVLHLFFVFILQSDTGIGGDGIFTYTLANNPYDYEYIDPEWKHLPQSNGWIDGHILEESYIVEDTDRFNYSSVYFHQRIDNHPLLYYSLVHTISSIFQNQYSKYFTLFINLVFVGGIDILLIKLFKKKYGNLLSILVPFSFLFLMLVIQQIFMLPRMYTMLAFFTLWYLYIHWKILCSDQWKKTDLIQMLFCIIGGSQTHYYFYVYAAVLTLMMLIYLLIKHQLNHLLNYIYIGVIGLSISWLCFPWFIWHIFFNQMQKHTTIIGWNMEKIFRYVVFMNDVLFNGRGIYAVIILSVLVAFSIIFSKKNNRKIQNVVPECFTFFSGVIYSLIIFTLDENNWYYMTGLYLVFVVWISMLVIDLLRMLSEEKKFILSSYILAAISMVFILTVSQTEARIEQNHIDNQIRKEFSGISIEYQDNDCIFVEEKQDNLFQGYYFNIAGYDEVKRISIEDFVNTGITADILDGRASFDAVVIYLPVEYQLDEEQYLFLSTNNDYNIYEIIK